MLGAAVSIGQAFFMAIYERRFQIGLMRAVGANRGEIRLLILGEALVIGLFSGIMGTLLGWLSIVGIKSFVKSSGFSFLPFDRLFQIPLWLPLLATGFALLFCLIGAYYPTQRAAKLDPAKVLHSG